MAKVHTYQPGSADKPVIILLPMGSMATGTLNITNAVSNVPVKVILVDMASVGPDTVSWGGTEYPCRLIVVDTETGGSYKVDPDEVKSIIDSFSGEVTREQIEEALSSEDPRLKEIIIRRMAASIGMTVMSKPGPVVAKACPMCGSGLYTDTLFCPECGCDIEAEMDTMEQGHPLVGPVTHFLKDWNDGFEEGEDDDDD
jgi:hypothetical protein